MIREARAVDAPELAALCTELGYPATEDDMVRRLAFLLDSPNDRVFVAVDEQDRAVAWLHAQVRRSLELDPYAQIAGLVVGETHRNGGVGAELVARAEAWARERGANAMRVHSNVVRERAHRFYLREGYSLSKTSRVFLKTL